MQIKQYDSKSAKILDYNPGKGKSKIFSFCTLVTDIDQYRDMIGSFVERGFTQDIAEYLFIDNSQSNIGDAYTGHNHFLNHNCGAYVVFCHQDIVAIDTRSTLGTKLAELDQLDSNWAIAGNAGYSQNRKPARRISDKTGENQLRGVLPQRVVSLDENFFILDLSKRVGFSPNLAGYHCYATDLVINAEFCGYNSYVIDFHVRHLGDGEKTKNFRDCRHALQAKISKLCRPRTIKTPSTFFTFGPVNKFARWATKALDRTQ